MLGVEPLVFAKVCLSDWVAVFGGLTIWFAFLAVASRR